ncbi:MAG: oxygenase, partial [Sphingomonas sp.]|nr:oxygenase [Sphingomonas sp.]
MAEAPAPSVASPSARLAATAGVQRVPTRELELFTMRGFLDPDTCAALIQRIDERRRPSEIADDLGVANFRTSETCDLDWREPLVGAVDHRIAELLGLPLGASEPLQGQRYAPGQEFKPLTDTFEPGGYDVYRQTAE